MSNPNKRGCPSPDKRKHGTRREALAQWHRLMAEGASKDLNVYRCGDHFHVGHSWLSLRSRIRQSRKVGSA